jgi:hypothetical protein
MPSRFPFRPVLCVAPGLVTVVLVACGGRGPLDTDIAAYDAADAAGIANLGPGEGTGPKADAGAKPADAGMSAKDAKAPGTPGLQGFPGLSEDAGGIAGCFACAEDKCGTQVSACSGSPACVEEGTCGLGCLTGLAGGTAAGGELAGGALAGGGTAGGGLAGGGLAGGGTAGGAAAGGLNLQCLMACDTNTQANTDLFAALECTFTACSSECLGALGGMGGALGGLGGGLAGGGLAGGGLGATGLRGASLPAGE